MSRHTFVNHNKIAFSISKTDASGFSSVLTRAPWHHLAKRVERSEEPSAGHWAGLPWVGSQDPSPCAERGPRPTSGTCGGCYPGPAMRSLPGGLRAGCGFSQSLCQHSSALPVAWRGHSTPRPDPTPSMTTLGQKLAGSEATGDVMGETFQRQICKKRCCVQSS